MTDKYDVYELVKEHGPVSVDTVQERFGIGFVQAQTMLTELRSDNLVELKSGVKYDTID